MPAQLFGDGLHLARGHALYVHLQHGRHQRFLAALIAFEYLRAEPPLPILRHAQLNLPNTRHERPVVIAGSISQSTRRCARLC